MVLILPPQVINGCYSRNIIFPLFNLGIGFGNFRRLKK
jgi:hypothetical protein